MNNEEKILKMLEGIGSDMSELKTDVSELKTDMSDVKQRLVKVEPTQENIVIPNIKALAESVTAINEKLITRSEIETMQEELSFLKDIIRMHTNQINDLRKSS